MANIDLVQLGDVRVCWEGRTVLCFIGVRAPRRRGGYMLSAVLLAVLVFLAVDPLRWALPTPAGALGGGVVLALTPALFTLMYNRRRRPRDVRFLGHDDVVQIAEGPMVPFTESSVGEVKDAVALRGAFRTVVLGRGDAEARRRVLGALRGLGARIVD